MAGDGSIIIDTQLDTEGLEKGLGELKSLIENGMGGAKDAFSKAIDEMGSAMAADSLAEGAGKMMSAAAEAVRGGASELYSAAESAARNAAEGLSYSAGDFGSGGRELADAAAGGYRGAGGGLGDAAVSSAESAARGLSSKTGDFGSGGRGLADAAAGGYRAVGGGLGDAAEASANEALGRLNGTGESFRTGGQGLSSATAEGISAGAPQVGDAAESAVRNAAARMRIDGEFSGIGANLMSALRGGLAAGAGALYAKAAEIAAQVVAVMKSAFSIHSPSAVFRDEIGKMLMLGLRDGIVNNRELVLAATEELAKDMLDSERRYLEEKERLDLESDKAEEERRVREYEIKLSQAQSQSEREELIEEERLRLKKRADSRYLDQLKETAENEREIIDTLKDDITSMYEEIAARIEDSLEPIAESREKLEKSLKSYASASTGARELRILNSDGEVESTLYGLADQRESIDMLNRYAQAMERAADRIKTEFDTATARDFMRALADMDIDEGALFAETLSAAPAEDFHRYIRDWGLKNTLAEEISRQIYGEEFTEAVDSATEYMRSELEAMGLEVPEGFFASGTLSAREFGEGFAQGLNEVLEDARRTVEGFGSFAGVVISAAAPVVTNNNYYSTYSVNGTRSTAAESIFALEAAATMNRYRGLD